MKTRCLNARNDRYPDYGGRGIKICKEWLNDFGAFLRDMGQCPEGLTLDRIDSNGDYEPGNCRWANWTEQQNNRTNNRLVAWEGRTQTISQWAKELGVSASAFAVRLQRMPLARAMTPGLFHTGGRRKRIA